MATLPLFDQTVVLTGDSHRVGSPGGYEAWRFVAHNAATQTWAGVSFQYGFPSHEYLRRYLRYRALPTRNAPPLPMDYPAVSVWTFSGNRFISSTVRVPAAAVRAETESNLQFGECRTIGEENRAIRMLTPDIDLQFRPRFSRNCKGAIDRWLIHDGLCDVIGFISIGDKKTAFSGIGFHDQRYGTAPLLGNFLRSVFFLKEKVIVIEQSDQTQIAAIATDRVSIETGGVDISQKRRTGWGLAYPGTIRLNDDLMSENAKVVASNWSRAWIQYDATSFGEKGFALCEIGDARRAGWPVIGHL